MKAVKFLLISLLMVLFSCSSYKHYEKGLIDKLEPVEHTSQNKYWPISVGNKWKYDKIVVINGKEEKQSEFVFEIIDTVHKDVQIGGKIQECVFFVMNLNDIIDKRFESYNQLILKTNKGLLFCKLKNEFISEIVRFIPNDYDKEFIKKLNGKDLTTENINFNDKSTNTLKTHIKESVTKVSENTRLSYDLSEEYYFKENIGQIMSKYIYDNYKIFKNNRSAIQGSSMPNEYNVTHQSNYSISNELQDRKVIFKLTNYEVK